ncbi:unnamed protein product [Lampetra planeri]
MATSELSGAHAQSARHNAGAIMPGRARVRASRCAHATSLDARRPPRRFSRSSRNGSSDAPLRAPGWDVN